MRNCSVLHASCIANRQTLSSEPSAGWTLSQRVSAQAGAAGIVAAANLALAVALALCAAGMSAEKELEALVEMRDMAMGDIEAEVDTAIAEAAELAENVRKLARDPFGSALPNLAGPLIALLLKSMKKDKE